MLLGVPGNIAMQLYDKQELRRIFLKEYAKDKPDLQIALDDWGCGEKEDLFDMKK